MTTGITEENIVEKWAELVPEDDFTEDEDKVKTDRESF